MDTREAGRRGGKRRAKTQTKAQLSAQGRKAVKARWRKQKEGK